MEVPGSPRLILCLAGLLLLGPFARLDASAQQATTWRVTLIRVWSEDVTLCENVSATFTIPGPVGVATVNNLCLAGVVATLDVATQNVTISLAGTVNFDGCAWNITDPIRGSGFISGDAVAASGMTGTAQTQQPCGPLRGNYTNRVDGRWQALRIGGGGAPPPPPPGGGGPGGNPTVLNFTGTVTVTRPGQQPFNLAPANLNLALEPGTWVLTGPASSVTLRFPNGDLALRENSQFTVYSRFFLLQKTPPGNLLRLRSKLIDVLAIGAISCSARSGPCPRMCRPSQSGRTYPARARPAEPLPTYVF